MAGLFSALFGDRESRMAKYASDPKPVKKKKPQRTLRDAARPDVYNRKGRIDGAVARMARGQKS